MRNTLLIMAVIMLLTSCQLATDVVNNAQERIKNAISIPAIIPSFSTGSSSHKNTEQDDATADSSNADISLRTFWLKKLGN